MIFVNDKKSLGSKSFTEDVFASVKPMIANDIDADWLEENVDEVEFFSDLDLTDLSVDDFNLLLTAVESADDIDSHWKGILLTAMQADPRFEKQAEVA